MREALVWTAIKPEDTAAEAALDGLLRRALVQETATAVVTVLDAGPAFPPADGEDRGRVLLRNNLGWLDAAKAALLEMEGLPAALKFQLADLGFCWRRDGGGSETHHQLVRHCSHERFRELPV